MAAGVITGDFMLRLPLDDFWPDFHLAPYAFVGFGGIFIGSPGNGDVSLFRDRFREQNRRCSSQTTVTLRGRALNRILEDFPGGSQILGHVGART